MKYFFGIIFIVVVLSTAGFANDPVRPPSLVDIMTPNVMTKIDTKEETSPISDTEMPSALPEAAVAPIPPLDPAQFPVLAKIKEKSENVSYDYLGKRFDLDIWLISGPGVMQIIYTLPDNKGAVIGGNLIDEAGADISSGLQQEFIQKNPQRAQQMIDTIKKTTELSRSESDNDADLKQHQADDDQKKTPSEIIGQLLEKSGKITFAADSQAPSIFVVMDPSQALSVKLWQAIQPFIKEQKMTIHIVPVATTQPEVLETLVAVLNAENRADAWRKLLAGEQLVASDTANTKAILDLKANLDVMQELRTRQVPLILYRTPHSPSFRVVRGIPQDWSKLKTELGLSSQKD